MDKKDIEIICQVQKNIIKLIKVKGEIYNGYCRCIR